MGGIFSSHNQNVVSQVSDIQNNFLQASFNECTTQTTQAQIGNTITINGSQVGNVGLTQSSSIVQGCQSSNSVNTNLTNLIKNQSQQTNKTVTGLLGFSFGGSQNYTYDTQIINNQLNQILANECNALSSQVQANNIIALSNATADNVVLSQQTNPSNTCVMSNVAKIIAFNSATSKADQSNTTRNGLVMIIIAMVVIVALLIGGALLILLAFGGFSLIGGGGGGKAAAAAGGGGGEGASIASQAAKLAPLLLA